MTRTRPITSRSSRALTAPLAFLLGLALALPAAATAAAPLGPGAEGPRVAGLQRAFGVKVDGVYGEALRIAVMRLQHSNGLEADGSVGPATWGLLERIRARARRRALANAAPAAPDRPRASDLARAPAPPPPRDPVHTAREVPALPARPRAGALSGGWGAALVTSLRLGSSRAIAGRVPARTGAHVVRKIAARTVRAIVPRRRLHIVAEPRLRIGAGQRMRRKRPAARPQLPLRVRQVIAAGNRIATMPYYYGGGHGNWNDSGYDCSGSVSYALHGAGLLDVALASGGLMSWGEPGPGRWISIYANGGHAFMVVAGRRFDTSGRGQTGSRWQTAMRDASGYVVRHPAGL
ncbi:MAG: hypothetical protein QOJ89_4815 [bacterium]|jgi:peptidoglycan hydrolase-like protein with peptidoglycan-binding domain